MRASLSDNGVKQSSEETEHNAATSSATWLLQGRREIVVVDPLVGFVAESPSAVKITFTKIKEEAAHWTQTNNKSPFILLECVSVSMCILNMHEHWKQPLSSKHILYVVSLYEIAFSFLILKNCCQVLKLTFNVLLRNKINPIIFTNSRQSLRLLGEILL